MDKFIKLSAIEQMAKPMAAFHGKDESYEEEDMSQHGCKCSCCGAPCDICMEDDTKHESEEDMDESEEYAD
jgi:hypothetical protein